MKKVYLCSALPACGCGVRTDRLQRLSGCKFGCCIQRGSCIQCCSGIQRSSCIQCGPGIQRRGFGCCFQRTHQLDTAHQAVQDRLRQCIRIQQLARKDARPADGGSKEN